MSTPPNAATAQALSETQEDALVAAANQRFIDDFVVAQNNAIQYGKSEVWLSTSQYCDIPFLMNYFTNLGYIVTFPDFAPVNGSQPGELFGPAFLAYWQNQLLPSNTKPQNPTRLGIAWEVTTDSDDDSNWG